MVDFGAFQEAELRVFSGIPPKRQRGDAFVSQGLIWDLILKALMPVTEINEAYHEK